jgi:curved DNA-binding protein
MRVRAERDYYAVLGVPESAAEEEIKRAYRRLALQHHPDRNPGDRRAEERFKELSEAYAVLMDAARRREYDRLRRARATGARARAPRWHDEEIFRDLFTDPRTASIFDDLGREWARMGFRFDEAFLRSLFFRGQAVVIIGPGGVRWVGGVGRRAPATRVPDEPGGPRGGPGPGDRARGAAGADPRRPAPGDLVPSPAGFLAWLWGRVREALSAPLRALGWWADSGARRGDLSYEIAVAPADLRQGGRFRVTIQRPTRIEELLVRVPPGVRPGTRLRLRGKGEPGADGTPGDLFLVVRAGG